MIWWTRGGAPTDSWDRVRIRDLGLGATHDPDISRYNLRGLDKIDILFQAPDCLFDGPLKLSTLFPSVAVFNTWHALTQHLASSTNTTSSIISSCVLPRGQYERERGDRELLP